MMDQLDIFSQSNGRELRDAGMKQAVEHADAIHGDWSDQAYNFIRQYINDNRGKQFTAEDVRDAAIDKIPVPPDNRAWGVIFVKAKKAGLIETVGFTTSKDPRTHMSYMKIWKAI